MLASSQTSLRQMAAQGLLLPDLAFRLTAVRFAIPPLRQRREDITVLAQSLLERICTLYQQRPVIFGPGTLAASSSTTGRATSANWPPSSKPRSLKPSIGIVRPDDLALPTGLEAPPEMRAAAQTGSLDLRFGHPAACTVCFGPESRRQSSAGPPTRHAPFHPLPHPRQRNHPCPLNATLAKYTLWQRRSARRVTPPRTCCATCGRARPGARPRARAATCGTARRAATSPDLAGSLRLKP